MKHLIVGTRGSQLAVRQTRAALQRLAQDLPFTFELAVIQNPGDRDLSTDLRHTPADFFTRDLDDALREGVVDCAIHSAKDLPEYPLDGGDIDWFWLPWREDPRDAWVLAPGKTFADLPGNPRVGVSSARREAYCLKRLPGARLLSVRGAIDSRLEQLDRGDYDALLMAGAALNRLGLADRVAEWISEEDLPPPEGQGYLAVTFRNRDPFFTRLRKLYTKAVRFIGAGVGSAELCTLAGARELANAECCLYDVLMDAALLKLLPAGCETIFVGKRAGAHSLDQRAITALILDRARRGKRVVRLKGGDPGLFGRLMEETEHLENYGLPFRVWPGVSALTAATTATGILLTVRGVSKGFCALTPRNKGDQGEENVNAAFRAALPVACFMGLSRAGEVARTLMEEDGWPGDTPAAVVLNAGADDQRIIRATLDSLHAIESDAPGLLILGENARFGFPEKRRLLLTCSEDIIEKARAAAIDFGYEPVCRPLIRLVPKTDPTARLSGCTDLIVTSPAAVRCLMSFRFDLRTVPRIIVCGPGTARAFAAFGLCADLMPESDFSTQGLLALPELQNLEGRRILRVRSEKAGSAVADTLRARGAEVDDAVLYRNEPAPCDALPPFDAVFFASASAVEVFLGRFGAAALEGKDVLAMGGPTARAGIAPTVAAAVSTVRDAVAALARHEVIREIQADQLRGL